jgi:hypothetical protein
MSEIVFKQPLGKFTDVTGNATIFRSRAAPHISLLDTVTRDRY